MTRAVVIKLPPIPSYQVLSHADFPYWDDLCRFIYEGHKPKWRERQLMKAAREFVSEYKFRWMGGALICEAPYGAYNWHFAVELKQEEIWNFPEFQEGRNFGNAPVKPHRDANPYKREHSRARSWDCGYILGLHEEQSGALRAYGKAPEDALLKPVNVRDGCADYQCVRCLEDAPSVPFRLPVARIHVQQQHPDDQEGGDNGKA